MLSARETAKWFIFQNPELASGYIDENTKVNKLLYFSELMYHCVNQKKLIDEDFIAFPNGPVLFSVYRGYRYDGLNALPMHCPVIEEAKQKVLEIVNFVYGNLSTDELVEESHSHSLWKEVSHLIPHNPKIDFAKADAELIAYNKALYETYSSWDFSKVVKEKINGNVYYFLKDSFEMSEEVIERLSKFSKYDEPKFLEMIDGELVVS